MAANFTVVSQTPETRVLGANQIADVERVGFVTHPSGVYAERLVPKLAWDQQGSANWIGPLATAIENMIAGGLASYASWEQQLDPTTSLMVDTISFVVTYDPGDGRPVQEALASIPVAELTIDSQFFDVGRFFPTGGGGSASPQDQVRAVYDTLVATTNL